MLEIISQYSNILLISIVTIFALFAISRSYLRLKHGNESMFEFLMWTGIWTGAIIVVFYPSITQIPARIFGISNGLTMLVYFAIVFLIYSTYRIYSKIETLEQEITKITRTIALKKK